MLAHYFTKCVDDILVSGKDKAKCYARFLIIFQALEVVGIIASLTKSQEGKELSYCGFNVILATDNGHVLITPCKKRLRHS